MVEHGKTLFPQKHVRNMSILDEAGFLVIPGDSWDICDIETTLAWSLGPQSSAGV